MESKYLGALKVLDRKVSLQESQPQAAESLRAAVYQVSACQRAVLPATGAPTPAVMFLNMVPMFGKMSVWLLLDSATPLLI